MVTIRRSTDTGLYAIINWEMLGNVMIWNEEADRLFSGPCGDPTLSHLLDAISEEDRSRFFSKIKEVGKKAGTGYITYTLANGKKIQSQMIRFGGCKTMLIVSLEMKQ